MVSVHVTMVTRDKGVSLRCAMNQNVQHMESVILPMEVVSVTKVGMVDSVDSKDVQMIVVEVIVGNVPR